MADNRMKGRRRAGRPPAGAKEGEKVKDYPQVTGLAQWRVIVEAINCFFHELPPTDRELVDGLSERLRQAG